MICELCICYQETFRLIEMTRHSFCVVVQKPLKEGHIMVLPRQHIESFLDLSPDEAKDLFDLVELMRLRLNKIYSEDVLMVRNTGIHSTQSHIHIHLLPSKGSLRQLTSVYEQIPARANIVDEVKVATQLRELQAKSS
ncbi:HIT domain-containing protein [Candidatus Woesearchaeota archaeon]|nr:HIT domain-containing protein [Candidatus Woesearchaeota archaeon]